MGYNEINLILNEGTKKSVPEIYMTKHGLKLFYQYQIEEGEMKMIQMKLSMARDELSKYNEKLEEWSRNYNIRAREIQHMPPPYNEVCPELDARIGMKPKPPKLTGDEIPRETWQKFENFYFLGPKYNQGMDSFLQKYYNIKPFEPWVMLNVSPDRAGTKIIKADICKFKRAFEKYMEEEWYSEWYVTFETGGNGDHLHLHAVCKMGSKMKQLKSVRTHIAKGNWKRQFMKYCKAEGFEGVKNQGCQAIIIQGENGKELLEDKKKYLIEEEKPAGHKNKTPNTLKGDWVINKRCYGSL